MIDFLEKIDLEALFAAIKVVAKNEDIELDLIGLKYKKSKRKLEIFVSIPEKLNKVKLTQDIYQKYQAEIENRESNGTINYNYFINIDYQKLLVSQNSGENMTNVHQYGLGDNVAGDKVMGDKINTQINNDQDLVQASKDIQALLHQLSTDYPSDSPRVLGAKAIDEIEKNPELKSRILRGVKAGSFAALEKMIDHPVAQFFIEGAKEVFKP
jgi:hypothetical protein